MASKLIVAVLAGGEGRRMGGLKALRPFRGATLLAHALAQARTWSDEVVVVVRDPAQAGEAPGAPLVLDSPAIGGPLAGLAAALAHAKAHGAELLFTLPCDTPALPADLPQQLAAALGPKDVVALPEVAGGLEPAVGLWRTQALEALPAYLAAGRSSLHGFAEAAGLARVAFGPESAAAFANANTPEALAALERRA
jgi:molybdopterin-guanine dinucleotide biosynthesis protein A